MDVLIKVDVSNSDGERVTQSRWIVRDVSQENADRIERGVNDVIQHVSVGTAIQTPVPHGVRRFVSP